MDDTNLDFCPTCGRLSMQVTPEKFICLQPTCDYLWEFKEEEHDEENRRNPRR